MIPQHLIDKAVQAVTERGGLVESAEIEAAIEAVALDILSEGWRRGAHDFDIDGVYTFEERDRMNPYTKETA